LPGAAVERTELETAARLSRAGGPTVDDAGGEVRLVGGPIGEQSKRATGCRLGKRSVLYVCNFGSQYDTVNLCILIVIQQQMPSVLG